MLNSLIYSKFANNKAESREFVSISSKSPNLKTHILCILQQINKMELVNFEKSKFYLSSPIEKSVFVSALSRNHISL